MKVAERIAREWARHYKAADKYYLTDTSKTSYHCFMANAISSAAQSKCIIADAIDAIATEQGLD